MGCEDPCSAGHIIGEPGPYPHHKLPSGGLAVRGRPMLIERWTRRNPLEVRTELVTVDSLVRQMTIPPSTCRTAPVVNELASEAK